MNILFIGDIYGSLGRTTVKKYLSKIKQDYKINFVIANGENAAHGRGITEAIYKAVAKALKEAVAKTGEGVLSSKGTL